MIERKKSKLHRSNRKARKQIMGEIYEENPVLESLGEKKDFKIIKARGKTKKYLEDIDADLEFYGKGTKSSDVTGSGYVPFKGKYRTVIDTEGKSRKQIKEAVKLDLISHGLHKIPEYSSFTKDLDKKLRSTYGDKMVDDNGGVDGYIRGYLSNQPEYDPYKKEMKFLGGEYFKPLDKILSGSFK